MNPIIPPDRGHLSTEQRHPRSESLDTGTVAECVGMMVDDHDGAIIAVRSASGALVRFIEDLVPRVRGGGRLIYLGAGTSGRLGVLDASECPPTFCSDPNTIIGLIAGGDAALRRSSESREDEFDGAHEELERLGVGRAEDGPSTDTVLGIAAGGTTPYVLGGIEFSKRRGAMTGLLTCSPDAQPRGCDHLIILPTGPELLTGSTRLKAGTATKLALNIITTSLFVQLGHTYGNLMVNLRATNDKLRDRALRILVAIIPDLSRDDAAQLLDAAQGDVKCAIVMHRLRECGAAEDEITPARAGALLDEHGGRLNQIIG